MYYISDNQSGSPKNWSFPESSFSSSMRRKKLAGSGYEIAKRRKPTATPKQIIEKPNDGVSGPSFAHCSSYWRFFISAEGRWSFSVLHHFSPMLLKRETVLSRETSLFKEKFLILKCLRYIFAFNFYQRVRVVCERSWEVRHKLLNITNEISRYFIVGMTPHTTSSGSGSVC